MVQRSPETGAVVWIDGDGESSHLELHLDQARKLPPVLARVGQVHVPAWLGVEAAKRQLSIFKKNKLKVTHPSFGFEMLSFVNSAQWHLSAKLSSSVPLTAASTILCRWIALSTPQSCKL